MVSLGVLGLQDVGFAYLVVFTRAYTPARTAMMGSGLTMVYIDVSRFEEREDDLDT